MKFPIEWHEKALVNQQAYVARLAAELKDMQVRLDRVTAEAATYERQINTAKAAGKDGFDSERYMVGKK